VQLEAAVMGPVRQLAQAEGVTLYMVLLAGFEVLLNRYTGQEDMCIGTPIAGRTRQETEGLIGFFVNTLVLRGDLSGRPTTRELLRRVRETTLGAYAHQELPFERLVEELRPERELSRTPLFQVMFILQNAPLGELELGEARLEVVGRAAATAKFELTLMLEEQADGSVRGYLEYSRELFSEARMERMGRHYERLVSEMARAPEQRVGLVELLSAAERAEQLVSWNATSASYPERCLHQLFEEQAERRPQVIAVKSEQGSLTYAELNSRANRLARHLRQLGVRPEVRVGILVEPSLEMMIGVLGILKAGGAYVPLDPGFPKDRVNYILEQSAIKIVLTTSALRQQLPNNKFELIELDHNSLETYDDSKLPNIAAPENAAYTIFTSGSTGRPKGVVVEHRQLVNYLHAIVDRFGLKEGANYAMLQPLAVDSCNTVLLPSMCAGGTLHVFPRERAADPLAVAEYFEREPMDVLKIAPSHLAALIDSFPSPFLLPRRALALGGEESRWDWLHDAVFPLAGKDCKVFIHYGPTETAVGMLTCLIKRDAPAPGTLAPLGSPLPNTRVYVLDSAGRLLPAGVTGELNIGGACVGRGYLQRPDFTAERFLPDPFSKTPGARLYRTGDLARWLPDGNIEFLGRTDYQIKIRGFRIELREIELVLLDNPLVDRALVTARQNGAGEKQIFAYVTLQQTPEAAGMDQQSIVTQLRASIAERLPSYMMPRAIMVLDAIPRTAQGKVDLQALPLPRAETVVSNDFYLPRNVTEARVSTTWAGLLGATQVGVRDDFFTIGGHSLLAVKMLSLIREDFGKRIPLAAFLQNPTVAHLSKLLTESEGATVPLLVKLQGGERQPFFCVHPIGGEIICYMQLATALRGKHPFYAFQFPRENGPASIEEVAALYLDELRCVKPDGPWALGGWSFGGLIAFEMTRQLRRQNIEVELLALFDTYPPLRERGELLNKMPLLARFGTDLALSLGRDVSELAEEFLQLPPERQRKFLRSMLTRDGISEQEFDELLSRFERNALARDKYFLEPIDQKIDLFVAADGEGRGSLSDWWRAWTTSGVNLHLVDGDHYSMLRQPHAGALALRLEQRLAELAASRPA
jgi:amino acid adenylation domain-containing protein